MSLEAYAQRSAVAYAGELTSSGVIRR